MDSKNFNIVRIFIYYFQWHVTVIKKGDGNRANTLWSLFFLISLAVIIESMVLRVIIALILVYGGFMYFVKNENIFNSD